MCRPTEQARLLASWAESAALVHEPALAAEKLDAAAALLGLLGPDDEFDISILHYYQGVCTFYLGEGEKADEYFQQALQDHRPDWLLQRACTTLLQAKVLLQIGKRDASLLSARSSLPLIVAVDAPLITWDFVDYIEELSVRFPDSQEVSAFIKEAKQCLILPPQRIVPRYFEAKLA